jgi:hypothetical protein
MAFGSIVLEENANSTGFLLFVSNKWLSAFVLAGGWLPLTTSIMLLLFLVQHILDEYSLPSCSICTFPSML